MAPRMSPITKSDATRLLKAAREAGYRRARVIGHPDGRIEVVADDPPEANAPGSDWDEVLN
jgi:tRNA(Phe) wybutosine-synthesizing methylase Tyw3